MASIPQYTDQYIGGAWQPSLGTEAITVLNPATEEAVAEVPGTSAEQTDEAIGRALAAAASWRAVAPGDRAALGHETAPGDGLAAGERPATGEPRVDAALGRLGELDDLPVSEHPQVYERIHGQLVEVLGELHSGHGPAAG